MMNGHSRRGISVVLSSACFWALIIAHASRGFAQDSQPTTDPTTAPATATQSAPALKTLTNDMFQGRGRNVDFDGSYATGMTWTSDGTHYLQRRNGRLMSIDALTDVAAPAYDDEAFSKALQNTGDFDDKTAPTAARNPQQWSTDRRSALVTHDDQIFVYSFSDQTARRLTVKPPAAKPAGKDQKAAGSNDAPKSADAKDAKKPSVRRELTLGPRGGHVAFVRDNDLYVIDAKSTKEQRLTRDGSKTILNGILDWVYQEEIYGRGTFRSFWWREDERFIAFLQLDEAPVPVYTIAESSPIGRPKLEETNYPKSGDPNPTVKVGIAPVDGGKIRWADLSAYKGVEILVVHVSWGPDGRLYFQVQDREQRWLDVVAADPATGKTFRVLHETSPAWIDAETTADPKWLADGTFLWLSTRDGFRHIYRYATDGSLLGRVTRGDWDVKNIIGYDEAQKLVYFNGTRETVLENHSYRAALSGGRAERLTEAGFSHNTSFDPTLKFFFDTYSNVTTPPRVALRRSDGALARVVSENKVKALDEYAWSRPEIVRFPARDGKMLNALLLKPLNFDSSKKYPVWSTVYGGPAAPLVRNTWQGRRMMAQQPFVDEGYLYWVCDTRLASCEGLVSAWQSWGRLGQIELEDLEDGVKWLVENASADPNRVGITGFSYGGYMTGYAMTHSKAFSVGICGAPVTDWHNYDSVYTERYMRLPANNKAGYDASSVVKAAANLYGDMLLVHGLIDDNVHFQNSVQFILELEKARKLFDLMVYPLDRHGIGHGGTHFRDLQEDYIKHRL